MSNSTINRNTGSQALPKAINASNTKKQVSMQMIQAMQVIQA
ncbi:hypothetical protein ACWGNU_11350 [Paenibacillus lautus]